MNHIEIDSGEDLTSTGKKKYGAALRIWHWINSILICGSLSTVLINSTLFDRDQSPFVQSVLVKAGASITNEQAYSVLHGMEDQVWGIHIYFGYAIIILLLFRAVTEVCVAPKCKLFGKFKNAYHNFFISKQNRKVAGHDLLVKSIYLVFYLLIFTMAVTGLLLAFKSFTGISKSVDHSIKEIHGFFMCLILGFIGIHVAGVLLAERKEGKGIVSDMINGGKAD